MHFGQKARFTKQGKLVWSSDETQIK